MSARTGGNPRPGGELTRSFRYNLKKAFPDDNGTSHLSVADGQGNAVAMTTTVNAMFGSKVMSPSTGIIFNDQMDDFSTPGQSNIFGLAPAEADYIAPGKKPLSSMSPLIVLREGKVRMVLGASGGPRIISSVASVLYQVSGRPSGGGCREVCSTRETD